MWFISLERVNSVCFSALGPIARIYLVRILTGLECWFSKMSFFFFRKTKVRPAATVYALVFFILKHLAMPSISVEKWLEMLLKRKDIQLC